VYYVCASLSLSLSLSREYGTLSLLWCTETHFCGIRYFFFFGCEGKRFTNPYHSSSNKGKNFRKKISLRLHSSRNQKISRFFFFSSSDKTSILVVVKTCLSHLVLILFFVCFFFYTHTARQKEKHTKKERDARAVRNRHGRRGRDDVRAKHPPGVPERFKGSRLMIEIVFSFFV